MYFPSAHTAGDVTGLDRMLANHRQRSSGCFMLTATGLVEEEWGNSTPYRIEIPEPF